MRKHAILVVMVPLSAVMFGVYWAGGGHHVLGAALAAVLWGAAMFVWFRYIRRWEQRAQKAPAWPEDTWTHL